MEICHVLTHKRKLRLARAMAGVVDGGMCIQLSGGIGETIVQGELGEVEASHEDVGLEPPYNVYDSFVRTTADEDSFAVLFNEQILLVTKIVGDEIVAYFFGETKCPLIVEAHPIVAIGEGEMLVQGNDALHESDSGMSGKGCVQADVFSGAVVMGKKGIALNVNGCALVQLQELCQSAAVIVVTVGEDGKIHLAKIYTQRLSIAGEQIGLSHVEEDLVFLGFDVQRKSVLDLHIIPLSCVF